MRTKRNRRKWNRKIAGAVIFLLLLSAIPVTPVQAASATITLLTEANEIRVGDMVEVQLVITADAVIGDFEAFLHYNDMVFEFYSAASCITGGAGSLKIADIGASPSQQDRTYHIYFQAIGQGECEIALYERPVVYSYSDGTEMSVTGFSKTFFVSPSNDASSDSSLSALYLVDNLVQTIELTPKFSPEITTYFSTINYLSDSLVISAISSDSKAKVEVSGGNELAIGNNEVFITVTAEDGSETIYTIYVYRLEEQEKIPEPELPEIILELGITAEEKEETVLLTEYHKYFLCERPEEFVVPDGYTQTILMINGIQMDAYVKQEVTEEEFLLLVLKNEAGEINWYRYDRVEQTLQRVCEEEYTVTQIIQQNEEELQTALLQYETQQRGMIIVVALLFGIILVLLMVILWLCIRYKNRG